MRTFRIETKLAGPQILAETQALGGCETGDANITRGYQLRARYVIPSVGPVYDGANSDEALLLENCSGEDMPLTMIAINSLPQPV